MQISGRQPTFDQMIVNSYQPGEGISSHVDLLKFEDGIAIISLGSSATMTFTNIDSAADCMPLTDKSLSHATQSEHSRPNRCAESTYSNTSVPDGSHPGEDLQQNVHLKAGDLLLLQGEARYRWKHGIAFNQPCSVQSSERRVSVTLRKLVQV